jgi:precorrin-2 dehydrogenase/sirohydrochlorin ferrochelatase
MLPVIIDPKYVKAIVIGDGPATAKRLSLLEQANVQNVKHFKTPPAESEFAWANIAYIADFDAATSEALYSICKKYNILTNIEDKKDFCDFHVPAIVRRGDLLITSSTNSKSPRLAGNIKRLLEKMFDESWAEKLKNINIFREQKRSEGISFDELAAETDKHIEEKGYFSEFCNKCRDMVKKL